MFNNFNQLKEFKTPEDWVTKALDIPNLPNISEISKKPKPLFFKPYRIASAASVVLIIGLSVIMACTINTKNNIIKSSTSISAQSGEIGGNSAGKENTSKNSGSAFDSSPSPTQETQTGTSGNGNSVNGSDNKNSKNNSRGSSSGPTNGGERNYYQPSGSVLHESPLPGNGFLRPISLDQSEPKREDKSKNNKKSEKAQPATQSQVPENYQYPTNAQFPTETQSPTRKPAENVTRPSTNKPDNTPHTDPTEQLATISTYNSNELAPAVTEASEPATVQPTTVQPTTVQPTTNKSGSSTSSNNCFIGSLWITFDENSPFRNQKTAYVHITDKDGNEFTTRYSGYEKIAIRNTPYGSRATFTTQGTPIKIPYGENYTVTVYDGQYTYTAENVNITGSGKAEDYVVINVY